MDLEELWNEKLEGRAWQVKEEFIALLAHMENHQVKSVLEIGCYKGGTALGFLEIGCNVCSVDIKLQPEVKDLRDSPRFRLFMRIIDINDFLPLSYFDMLFIDGDHSYENCKKDYEEFLPFVKKGGLIVFHDIVNSELHKKQGCEVWRFWNKIKGQHYHEFIEDGNWGGIGVTYKD